jgi:hypothetical protein
MGLIVYQTGANGVLIGPAEADESPLEPGVHLLPAGCVEIEPPSTTGDEYVLWDGVEWQVKTPPAPEPVALPTVAYLQAVALSLLPGWEQTERGLGIDHAGHLWLTTPAALQDIRDSLLAGMVPGNMWIDAERQPVPMTLPDLQALWGAIVTAGAAIYQRRLQMEAEIAAMDASQLAAFEPGWPA